MSQKDSTVSEEGNKLIDFRWTRIESNFSLSETWKKYSAGPYRYYRIQHLCRDGYFLGFLHFPKLPPPFKGKI